MPSRPVDRREHHRGTLIDARRRHPRLCVVADIFYESEDASLAASELEASLQGLFIPTSFPDSPGAKGVARFDLGEGPLVTARVEVTRIIAGAKRGMVLRIVSMSELDRLRVATFLLRRGGLVMFPHLARRYQALAAAERAPGTRAARAHRV